MAIIENFTSTANIHRNTVIHANCLTILPKLPASSVDFILTDPPYITRYKSRDGRTVPNDDNAAWLKPAFAEMYRVLAPDSFCRELLRMAAGRPLHAGLPRRRIPGRRSLRLSRSDTPPPPSFCATSTNARTCWPKAIRSARRHDRRRDRLDLQRQQAASDAEACVGAAAAHRDILPPQTARCSIRSRFRLLTARGKDARAQLYRHRAGCEVSRDCIRAARRLTRILTIVGQPGAGPLLLVFMACNAGETRLGCDATFTCNRAAMQHPVSYTDRVRAQPHAQTSHRCAFHQPRTSYGVAGHWLKRTSQASHIDRRIYGTACRGGISHGIRAHGCPG